MGHLRVVLRLGQTLSHIRLREPQFFSGDQGVDHPAHGISEPLVSAHRERGQGLFAEHRVQDDVLLGVGEAGTGRCQLGSVGGHGTAAVLEVTRHDLIEVLVFDRCVSDALCFQGVVEVLLGCGS